MVRVYALSSEYVVSDQACVTRQGKIYVIGGYDQNYKTRDEDETLPIEVVAKTATSVESMLTRREDDSVVTVYLRVKDTAYIMRGISDDNGWFFGSPQYETEKYCFDVKKLEAIPELKNNRGDKAHIFDRHI